MAKKGRKPKPTRIHELQGGSKKTHRPMKNEPQPANYERVPSPPGHLDVTGKNEWRRVAKHLHDVGLLTKIDRAALAGYCQTYQTWVDAQEKIKKTGLIIKAPSGYPIVNPLLSISNNALGQMRAFLTEFGMTPSSRTRVKPEKGEKKKDPLKDFQEKGKKLEAVK